MLPIQRSLILVGTLLALVVLTGCGPTPLTPAADLSPTPTTRALSSPTGTPTPAARRGSVTLHTDTLLYQTGDTISVTLNNQSTQTIYFPDHLTNCSVILLQRSKAQPLSEDGGPAGINPCQLATATRMDALGPGQHLVVKLVAPTSGWPPGLYLATLSYRTSPSAGPSTPLSSPAFTVGPPAPQP